MKFHHLAAWAAVLVLTGCANMAPSNGTDSTGASTATPTASPIKPHVAEYPAGQLRPISAAEASSRGVAQLTPPADLWERIRRGYGMPNLESDLVVDREQ